MPLDISNLVRDKVAIVAIEKVQASRPNKKRIRIAGEPKT